MNKCCQRLYELLNGSPTYYESRSAASENGQSFQISTNNKAICRVKTDKGVIPL